MTGDDDRTASPADDAVTAILADWADALGADREGYLNHTLRVVHLADLLYRRGGGTGESPLDRPEFAVAAAFHDLGIWSDGTWDYLPPSIERARQWLADAGRADQIPLVTTMIDDHHKLRSAGDPLDPVELFRRADTIDFTSGTIRFGVPIAGYRDLRRAYPSAGFHRKLVRLATSGALRNPLRPAPMVKF